MVEGIWRTTFPPAWVTDTKFLGNGAQVVTGTDMSFPPIPGGQPTQRAWIRSMLRSAARDHDAGRCTSATASERESRRQQSFGDCEQFHPPTAGGRNQSPARDRRIGADRPPRLPSEGHAIGKDIPVTYVPFVCSFSVGSAVSSGRGAGAERFT